MSVMRRGQLLPGGNEKPSVPHAAGKPPGSETELPDNFGLAAVLVNDSCAERSAAEKEIRAFLIDHSYTPA